MKSPDPEAQTHGTQLHSKAQSHHHLIALIYGQKLPPKNDHPTYPTIDKIPGTPPTFGARIVKNEHQY